MHERVACFRVFMAMSRTFAAFSGRFGTEKDALVEVGSMSGAHGLEGAVRVRSRTAMPEVRLATSGWRWIRAPGHQTTKQVWLESGTKVAKDVYAVKMRELATREEAEALVGAVLLALADERPPLEDDEEVYQDQLIGVDVWKRIHSEEEAVLVDPNASKDTSDGAEMTKAREGPAPKGRFDGKIEVEEEPHPTTHKRVGKVVGFVDGTGTYDTITVELAPSFVEEVCQASGTGAPEGEQATAFVPFAKDIVVSLDMKKRYMVVDPPDGLLEMGLTGVNAKKKKVSKRRWRRKGGLKQRMASAPENGGDEHLSA